MPCMHLAMKQHIVNLSKAAGKFGIVKNYYEIGTIILAVKCEASTDEPSFVGIFYESNGIIDAYFLHNVHTMIADGVLT